MAAKRAVIDRVVGGVVHMPACEWGEDWAKEQFGDSWNTKFLVYYIKSYQPRCKAKKSQKNQLEEGFWLVEQKLMLQSNNSAVKQWHVDLPVVLRWVDEFTFEGNVLFHYLAAVLRCQIFVLLLCL
jgi:hypothetical protein